MIPYDLKLRVTEEVTIRILAEAGMDEKELRKAIEEHKAALRTNQNSFNNGATQLTVATELTRRTHTATLHEWKQDKRTVEILDFHIDTKG